jgi:hypothetical protein
MDKKKTVSGVTLALCLALGVAAGPAAAEIPASPEAGTVGAPVDIAGAWKMMFQFTNCDTGEPLPTRPAFPSLNTFFADGSLIESSSGLSPANRTISHGRWQQTGKRTVIARSELQLFEGGPTYTGYQVLERKFTLSADGTALSSKVRWTRFNTSNVQTFNGCATAPGTRQPDPEPWNRT